MFAVGECVFYSATGVCRITGIRAVKLRGMEEQECYVLKPVGDSSTIIYVPTDHDESLCSMRPVLTKDEISELIKGMPNAERISIPNERERGAEYFSKLRSCDSRDLVKVIKTLYFERARNKANGKGLNMADTKIMSSAEKLLYEEFSFVLGIDQKDVAPYILERIPQEAL